MKVKFIPFAGFLFLFASLVCAGWLAVVRKPEPVNAHDIFVFKKNNTDFKVPDPEEMAQVQDISKKLILIANQKTGMQSDIDLKLFGEKKIAAQVIENRKQRVIAPQFSYRISFTFVSDQNQYCYVNNKFYQQGDVMPDGGKISRIESRQVLILKNNIAEWVPVLTKSVAANKSRQRQ